MVLTPWYDIASHEFESPKIPELKIDAGHLRVRGCCINNLQAAELED